MTLLSGGWIINTYTLSYVLWRTIVVIPIGVDLTNEGLVTFINGTVCCAAASKGKAELKIATRTRKANILYL